MSSTTSYLNRARLRAEGECYDLRYAQNVGKAAHNIMALWGTSLHAYRGVESVAEGHRVARSQIIGELATAPVVLEPAIQHRIDDLRGQFIELQGLQDSIKQDGDGGDAYFKLLEIMAIPLQTGFIQAAENYGWPEPGLSSTEDVRLWQPAPGTGQPSLTVE